MATPFGVSGTFLKKILRQRRETGTLAPKPRGGGQVAKREEGQREKVRAYILRTRNDATVSEVHAYVVTTLRREVIRATVGRVLQSLDLPRKKTLVASERDEGNRAAFRAPVTSLERERVIFVDERARRRPGRGAMPGLRGAYGRVPRNHGSNLSVIGAQGLRGMIATLSVEGAVDTEIFNIFVNQVLVPAL